MARTGKSPLSWADLSARAGGTAKQLAAQGFGKARFLRADGRAVHEAGGSEAQELAFAIACGVAYLRLLEGNGFALDDARHRISFILAADADEFLTIAKFRSIRKLWARVEEACGLAPKPAYVAAETAWRMMTQRDPYVNMLRTTIAVTAAGLGGADSIARPAAHRGARSARCLRAAGRAQHTAHSARRIQSLPRQRSGRRLRRHRGPDRRTGAAAWALFQDIEAAGGAAAAIEQGLLQKNIAATRAARQTAVARRKDALTGTSDYPNLAEDGGARFSTSRRSPRRRLRPRCISRRCPRSASPSRSRRCATRRTRC